MSTFWIALCTWLHTLATVIMIGHYVLLSLVYLPVFERQIQGEALGRLFEALSARMRPFFGGSMLIFIVTGIYLMFVNESYLGLGDFGNRWSILMVAKHVLVVVFLGLGIYSERAFVERLGEAGPTALNRLRLALGAMTILGVAVLLLTAMAQAA